METDSHATEARHPFGDATPTSLDANEIDAITRALTDAVLPMTAAWSGLLGRDLELSTGKVQPIPERLAADAPLGSTVLDGLCAGTPYRAVADLGGDLGTVAVVVPTGLGHVTVDLLLGGAGRVPDDRELSAIDADLLAAVVEPTLGAIARLASGTGREPRLLTDLEPHEITHRFAAGVATEWLIRIGAADRPLFIVFSPRGAHHLAGSGGAAAAETSAEENGRLLRSVMADVVIEAVVSFPPVDVPSETVLRLDVGDVLGLGHGTDDPLPMQVDGLHLADVRPARAGDELACQVVATVEPLRTLVELNHASPRSTDAHSSNAHQVNAHSSTGGPL